MAVIKGFGGKVMVGAVEVGGVRNWEIEVAAEDLDATAMNQAGADFGWRKIVPGLRSWTGTIEFLWDSANSGQAAIRNAILNATELQLQLYVDAAGNEYYSGNAFVTTLNTSTPVDDLVSGTAEISGNGAITFNDAP